MYGYVRPFVPMLRVREHELYKALYCGLCRTLKLHICRSSQFTLSYDLVFLAIVRSCVSNEKLTIKWRRCIAHPLKKRQIAEPTSQLKYSAEASALLTYYKICDDKSDEKGIKRLVGKMATPSAKKFKRRANLPELDQKIASGLNELYALEKGNDLSPDLCADKFGSVLGEVFSYGESDKAKQKILRNFGTHIGRWIYLLDAADDYEDDKKHGKFNPYSDMDDSQKEFLTNALNMELAEAEKAMILLESENKILYNIIENIIYLGLPETVNKILYKNEGKNK